jgi:hypothetical protein
MFQTYSSLLHRICRAKLFMGNGAIGNRIPSGTPFLCTKANPLLTAKKKVPTKGGAKLWSACSLLALSRTEARFRPECLGRPGQAPFTGGTPVKEISRQQASASGKSASKLAQAKAAASCTHSKASLRTTGGRPITSVLRARRETVDCMWRHAGCMLHRRS